MKCILLTQVIAQKTIKIICNDEKSEKLQQISWSATKTKFWERY